MTHPITARIEADLKSRFEGEGTGHDWFHIDRVRKNALQIAETEGADPLIVELGALLHDIADHKFHNHDLKAGPDKARAMLMEAGADAALAERVARIVAEVSYKGAGVETPVSSPESAAVQDADRLDALGAIGIARAFAYGGSKNRPMYAPGKNPEMHTDFWSYATAEGSTVNHFYEKLLLLKDRMQTAAGKEMARSRHAFMEDFLRQFFEEWNP